MPEQILQLDHLLRKYGFNVFPAYVALLYGGFTNHDTKSLVFMISQLPIVGVCCGYQALKLIKNGLLTIPLGLIAHYVLFLCDVQYLQRIVPGPLKASAQPLKGLIFKIHFGHAHQPFFESFDHGYFLFANKINQQGLEPITDTK